MPIYLHGAKSRPYTVDVVRTVVSTAVAVHVVVLTVAIVVVIHVVAVVYVWDLFTGK